ncbi:MAG: DUF4364 family protein [Butyrivibrio sp.]|nr:DUF4364 family protein [Butyrivibrio sp.]
MSSRYLTLYKMIVLYMLKRCEVPLSKSQIYDFILEKEYTTFLTLQEVFAELVTSELIVEKTVANRTFLEITAEGEETLQYFANRINPSIRQQIDEYLTTNSLKLRNETAILGDYTKTGDNEYTAHLVAREGGKNIIDISMPVPTEEIALAICENWQKKNEDIYSYLVRELMG